MRINRLLANLLTLIFLTFLRVNLSTQSLNVVDSTAVEAVRASLSKAFRPGQFFSDMASAGVKFGISREQVVNRIVAAAEQHFAGTICEQPATLNCVRCRIAIDEFCCVRMDLEYMCTLCNIVNA